MTIIIAILVVVAVLAFWVACEWREVSAWLDGLSRWFGP